MQIDQQQGDEDQFRDQEDLVVAHQRLSRCFFSGGCAPMGCSMAEKAPPTMPCGALRPCSSVAAMCITAAPAERPENRNRGPRMALFHNGRATMVLSRMPV